MSYYKNGYVDGWVDAMEGRGAQPFPGVDNYTKGYRDGYAVGEAKINFHDIPDVSPCFDNMCPILTRGNA